jgi:integrase/recombinase XerD
MRVSAVVTQYIAYKRSLGMRFNTEARALKSFYCYVRDKPLSQIEPAQVRAFLDGRGPVTRFWHHKYGVLRGFYRYAIARGHTNTSPLPNIVPKGPAAICPVYFHSRRAPAINSGHRSLSKHAQPITAGDVPHIVAALVRGCAAHQ